MGPFSLCLCGRREPGPRVRTDPAHAMLGEQLRASASPRRSAMCPTGPAEGSGPRGLSTHRVESLSEAAQGTSGPSAPQTCVCPSRQLGLIPDVSGAARVAGLRRARGPGPHPPLAHRGRAGPLLQPAAAAPRLRPRASPLGRRTESRPAAQSSRGRGCRAAPWRRAAVRGQGLAPWDWGARRPARPLGGEGAAGCPPPKRCSVARPPREQPGPSLSSGPEPGKQGGGQRPRGRGRGGGAEATARPATLPTEHGQGTDLRVSLQGAPAVTTLRVRLGTVGTPGPSALNRRPEVDWPVLASEGPAVGEGFRAAARALGARPRTRLWMGRGTGDVRRARQPGAGTECPCRTCSSATVPAPAGHAPVPRSSTRVPGHRSAPARAAATRGLRPPPL